LVRPTQSITIDRELFQTIKSWCDELECRGEPFFTAPYIVNLLMAYFCQEKKLIKKPKIETIEAALLEAGRRTPAKPKPEPEDS